ncbi:hypothetical protein [Streptomyces sp. NPDC058401]|uniref:hypothetical protein n=1 Tax=Streptomyces sp. NPDC058401 TaxID=3346480 RepID=UPI00365411CC
MRTSTRIAGVLTGLTLALGGGTALMAPSAQADVTQCIDQVERELQGGEAPDSVRMSCYVGLTGDHAKCVKTLTEGRVSAATAEAACQVAPE